MITLTSTDGKMMRFNPDLIAVRNTIENFATGGELVTVTALWCGGDQPFYVLESEDLIDRIVRRDGGYMV